MARVAWKFVDPTDDEEYFWPVNPNGDGGSDSVIKAISYNAQAATRKSALVGDTIDNVIFQSSVQQSTFSYTGNVYNETDYNNLKDWCNKNYPVELYDDLGRGKLVYITDLSFSRVRSAKNLFKHSYTFNGIILEEL